MRAYNPLAELGELLGQRIQLETEHVDYIDQSASELFEETPVDLSTFLYDKKYLKLPPLSKMQYDFVEAGTQIYYPATLQKLGWKQLPYYNMLVGKWGKGSGKDTVSRLILARLAHQLLCLKDPQKYLNSMPGDSINMLNVAYSSKQAQEIFFEPLKRILSKSLWFRDKFEATEDRIRLDKEISIVSGHSEQESQEGNNLIAAVLDEIAAFKTKAELEQRQRRSVRALEHSAEALADMVTSSAVSRFPQVYKIIYISFTRFKGDFIEQKYDEGLKRPKTAYVSMGATWEVNPTKKREDFNEEYEKNPENARARFECLPPLATDAFFKQLTQEIKDVVFPKLPESDLPLTDNPYKAACKDWYKGIRGVNYYAHIDLGLSKDRAGICICHRAGFDLKEVKRFHENGLEYYESVRVPRVAVDIWVSILAPAGGEISFEEIREFLIDLHTNRDCFIVKLTFDKFQSADSIQILTKRGMNADLLSVDRDTSCYDTLKDLIYACRLQAYYRERGVGELERLNIVGGNKVDHPLQGSKDEADALAGAVYNAVTAEYMDSDVDDAAAGYPYNEQFANFELPKQPGIWTQRDIEGRNEY